MLRNCPQRLVPGVADMPVELEVFLIAYFRLPPSPNGFHRIKRSQFGDCLALYRGRLSLRFLIGIVHQFLFTCH